jgi:hypothetical protein
MMNIMPKEHEGELMIAGFVISTIGAIGIASDMLFHSGIGTLGAAVLVGGMLLSGIGIFFDTVII